MGQQSITPRYNGPFPGVDGDSAIVGDNYISGFSEEATLQIPWGAALQKGVADDGYTLYKAQTARTFAGFLVFRDSYPLGYAPGIGLTADSNGNIGLLPKSVLTVKIRGTIWIQTDEAVTKTSAVRIRLNNTGAGVGPGIGRASAVAGQTVNLSLLAEWCGTYDAGKAKLRFEALLKGSISND